MKATKVVSVIIPTYNRAELLGEAIDSVLGQTHKDLQLIVVDDGSTDETSALLQEYRDERILVIHQENMGKSAARNRGLKAVEGDFVAFLDSDDIWDEQYLEVLLSLFSGEPELDFAFCDLRRFDEAGLKEKSQFEIVPEVRAFPTRPSQNGAGQVVLKPPFPTLVRLTQFVTWLQCVVIRTETIRNITFPPGMPLGQDYAFMLEVYAASKCFGFVDRALVFLRRHAGNSYFSSPPRRLGSHALPTLDALMRIETKELDQESIRVLRLRTGIQLRGIGKFYLSENELMRAAKYFGEALKYRGERWKATLYLFAIPLYSLKSLAFKKNKFGDP